MEMDKEFLDIKEEIEELGVEYILEILPIIRNMPPVEVAELLDEFDSDAIAFILKNLDIEQQGLVVAEFNLSRQIELFKILNKREFAKIFEQMPPDVYVDLYQHLEPEEQAELLPYLSLNIRENVIKLSKYPEETAGGIMTTDFFTVNAGITCQDVINLIRLRAPSNKALYHIYVIDENNVLLGIINIEDLIKAQGDTLIDDIMTKDYEFVYVDEDREKVAEIIAKYDLITLPVLNYDYQLIGVVTSDDAIEVIHTEQTEDLEKFMGIVQEPEYFDYMGTSTVVHFKKRIVWLIILAIIELFSGMVINHFQPLLQQIYVLALFMPMLTAMGGNAGSQSATVIVRALALGQVNIKEWFKIIWKELRIAILLAAILGLLTFINAMILNSTREIPQGLSVSYISFVIALSMAMQVISSTFIGAFFPLLVKAFKGDPALAASPAIATLVDITGLLVYFSIASLLL